MDINGNESSSHLEAGRAGATIEIKIKTMDSQTYTLQVDKQVPVPALKEQIASVTGVVTEQQRLICRGKVLKDDQLLSTYHVEDGHTLHLVVRDPASSSTQNLHSDPVSDHALSGSRGQFYQVAPGVFVETINMPAQGDRMLPDISRIVSAVLGSIGLGNSGHGSEGNSNRASSGMTDTSQVQPEQSSMGGENDRSRSDNAVGVPAAVSIGQPQAIPDSITTLSQYLRHMKQEFINNGRANNDSAGASSPHGTEERDSSPSSHAGIIQGVIPTPESLADLLSSTQELLDQQVRECLLRLARQLEDQASLLDSVVRLSTQSSAWRTGVLLQNLGAYFLELGRTTMMLRLGRSPSEAVVNAGPAVFVSPSGPNPLMVQPLPFQPGASFGASPPGTVQSGSGMINGFGSGFLPRRIDIQIRRGPSSHSTEAAGSQQPSSQRNLATHGSGGSPVNQPNPATSDGPSSSGATAVHILPLRTMVAAVPDLNHVPSEASGSSVNLFYPLLGRYQNMTSGNLSSRTGSEVSSDHPLNGSQTEQHHANESAMRQQNIEDPQNGLPPSSFGQRQRVRSRTIDINILSTGGDHDQNPEGQIQASVLQFLRNLFPGGEIHVENASTQEVTTDQGRTSSAPAEEAQPSAAEEGMFLSRLLQQILPVISQVAGSEENIDSAGEADHSEHRDDTSSSSQAELPEFGTSRRQSDPQDEPPNAKRQKME